MALIKILLIFACSTIVTTVNGELAERPISVAAIVGDTVWLDCTSNDNSSDHKYTWLFNQMEPTPVTIVFDCQVNPAYSDLYDTAVTVDGGCRIGIRSINYASAGTYTCQHNLDQGSADLVVLNSNSSCSFGPTDVISGEFITLMCVLNYLGPQTPHVEFRSETGMVYTNATINTFPTQVNGQVVFPVYPPTTRAVTANTFFNPPIAYTLTWTLPTLRVQFPPTILNIDVAGESCETYYSNYTVLTCTGDAWPPATYHWLDNDSGLTYPGQTITLTNLGLNHYSCVVENEIRDVKYNATLDVRVDISEGVPSTCPPEPETTQTEPETTTEPTTTTTPEPTSSIIPINECGSRFQVAPQPPTTAGWNLMCYIDLNDTQWLNTACVDLLQKLPPDIGDYSTLVARGGQAGCSLLTGAENVWTGANSACFRAYQLQLSLSSCASCNRLVMCIQLPPGGQSDSDLD